MRAALADVAAAGAAADALGLRYAHVSLSFNDPVGGLFSP